MGKAAAPGRYCRPRRTEFPVNIIEVINVPWWNAAAQYCITITDALMQRGHRAAVIAGQETPSYQKAVALNIPVDPLVNFSPIHFLGDLMSIKNAFRTVYHDVQIVNVHTAPAQTLFVLARALFDLRYRLIRTRVDARGIKQHPFNKYSYRGLDGIIVANNADREELLSFTGLAGHRVKIIHAGVDTGRFRHTGGTEENRQKYGLPSGVPVVGNIARRSPVKGHDVFFKAAHLIHNEVPDAVFVTAGVDDTVSLEALREMARQAGVLEKTVFLNYVDTVEELINCLDVGVVSSVGSENHSRITLEYMACGVPVVGSQVGDIAELIDDRKTGFVVRPGDFVAMADAVVRLLKDRELRGVFGYTARRLVEQRFSIDTFAELTELFYLDVLRRKRNTTAQE